MPLLGAIKEKTGSNPVRVKSAVPKMKNPMKSKSPKFKLKKKNNFLLPKHDGKIQEVGILDLQTESGHNLMDRIDDKVNDYNIIQNS